MWFGFLQNTKVVLLEELACQFGLRTQDAIDRLQSLQDMERITGNIIFSIFCLNTSLQCMSAHFRIRPPSWIQ